MRPVISLMLSLGPVHVPCCKDCCPTVTQADVSSHTYRVWFLRRVVISTHRLTAACIVDSSAALSQTGLSYAVITHCHVTS